MEVGHGGLVEADSEETAEKMELSAAEVQEGWASVFVARTRNSLTPSIRREKKQTKRYHECSKETNTEHVQL